MIIELRPATRADGPTVAEMFLEAFTTTLPSIALAHTPDECREHFSTTVIDEYETWVALIDGEHAGFFALSAAPDTVTPIGTISDAMLDHLYLRPSYTGCGIGERCLHLAKYRRPAGLDLWTFQINAGARRFYERHGFTAVYLGDGRDNEEGEPDVRYAWRPEADR